VLRRNSAFKSIEDPHYVLRFNADAVIPNGEERLIAIFLHSDFNGLAGAEFDRIEKQVVDDLLDARSVPLAALGPPPLAGEAPAFMAETAASSPTALETKMNGISSPLC